MDSAQARTHRSYAKAALLALLLVASAYTSLSTASAAPADEGQAIFQQKCQGCHSIGQGRRVGPDLQGVTQRRDRNWVLRFITAPDQLIAQGDPAAKLLVQEYGTPMPNLGVSAKDAEALLAFVESQSGKQAQPAAGKNQSAARADTAPEANQAAAQAATAPGDATAGRALFTGETTFVNGGVACVSCHSADSIGGFGGGSVGKNLTTAYTTLGQNGLRSILAAAPFPIMKEAFTNHPLTDDEVANVIAFLRQESAGGNSDGAPSPYVFPVVALVVFIVIMGLIQLIWRGRLQGVRQPLVKGASK